MNVSMDEAPDEHERVCDLPFSAEYAKSNRSTCRKCKTNIGAGSLRMSVREKSHAFDGVVDKWYHSACFWTTLTKAHGEINESSIRGMDWLKWEDQESIREKIIKVTRSPNAEAFSPVNTTHSWSQIKIEYARSSRGKCYECKNAVEMGKPKYYWRYGWYHLDCLMAKEKSFEGVPILLKNFGDLKPEDRAVVEAADRKSKGIKEPTPEPTASATADEDPETKMEADDGDEAVQSSLATLKVDNSTAVTVDEVEAVFEKAGDPLMVILNLEGEEVRPGPSIDRLDIRKRNAAPSGSAPEDKKVKTEGSDEVDDEKLKKRLKRQANYLWEIREGLKEVEKGALYEIMRFNDMEIPSGDDKLYDRLCDAGLFGRATMCPKCPDGHLVFSTSAQAYVCLGHISEWTKCSYSNKNPVRTPITIPGHIANNHPILNTLPFNSMGERVYSKAQPITGNRIVVNTGAAEVFESSVRSQLLAQSGPMSTVVATKKSHQIIKKGTVVDGDCAVGQYCHVYRNDEGVTYTAALGLTDMAANRNSFYKMQLLVHDTTPDTYYVFKSWGRVGTGVGDNKTESYRHLSHAINQFEHVFAEKSGNEWADKKYFRKRPGKYTLLDMDYSELENEQHSSIIPGSKTMLPKQIQDLIQLIFNVETMKAALKSFDLDMEAIPLGKLSKKQLTIAYGVLNELQALMDSNRHDADAVLDASNRFYSLVPHASGMVAPPKLDNKEIIQKKSKLLDNLMDIAVAVQLMRSGQQVDVDDMMDPIDRNFIKLSSRISVVNELSPDYSLIERYLENTHGDTHDTTLKIQQIYKVDRNDEERRFNKALGNRMLLWHGSGVANYVGILSQGLRIAPPEAPHAGYMFGKGIYFADMVSKSANYCRCEASGGTALLLLCDVALGKVQEHINATSANPLTGGSTAVKGMGATLPDPTVYFEHPDGYRIPYGKPTKSGKQCSLLYNEYIVYDVKQVNIKYLIRVHMSYGRRK